MMNILKGAGTEGYAEGRAFVVRKKQEQDTPSPTKGGGLSVSAEKERFHKALEAVKADLEKLISGTDGEMAGVFSAHLEMASDPLLEENVMSAVERGLSAEESVGQAEETICAMFSDIEDEYLRVRADDVKDVCGRILSSLASTTAADSSYEPVSGGNPFALAPDGSVIVAESLSPSDTALMDFSKISAIVTEEGSVTSHVCIISHSKGIPALVGVKGCMAHIKTGEKILVDCEEHTVTVNPTEEVLAEFRKAAYSFKRMAGSEMLSASKRAVTLDGTQCGVYGNAGSVEDVKAAMASGADGIGLFRSEFLFMNSKSLPSEEEQFISYRNAAEASNGKPIIIRTLDIGGDKPLPCMKLPFEENPFLGLRGIRLCLSMSEMFKTQLRALLRAGAFADIRILLPMVSMVEEVVQTRKLISECESELSSEGLPYRKDIPVGVMIETPSAAGISDLLARVSDFFSVGTNDLTQYVMAADRGNASVSYLYDVKSEAVTRMLRNVARNALKVGIPVEVCGEAASDLSFTETLLGLGITAFSVSAPAVAPLKNKLRGIKRPDRQ